MLQARTDEPKVVVKGILIRGCSELDCAVSPAAEPDPVAVAGTDRRNLRPLPDLARVERRIDVDEPERLVRERREHLGVVGVDDPVPVTFKAKGPRWLLTLAGLWMPILRAYYRTTFPVFQLRGRRSHAAPRDVQLMRALYRPVPSSDPPYRPHQRRRAADRMRRDVERGHQVPQLIVQRAGALADDVLKRDGVDRHRGSVTDRGRGNSALDAGTSTAHGFGPRSAQGAPAARLPPLAAALRTISPPAP